MNHSAIIDALLRAQTRKKARLAVEPVVDDPDFQAAVFQRIRTLFGESPRAAAELARYWRLYSKSPELSAGALRIRAVHERLNGRWLASANSSIKAGSFASDPLDKLRFCIGAIDAFGRAGKIGSAIKLGNQLLRGFQEAGERSDMVRVSINVGNALLWRDDHVGASHWFARAIEFGDEEAMPFEWASAALGASTSALYAGELRDAIDLAGKAELKFEELGLLALVLLSKINRAHAFASLGRYDDALSLFLEVRKNPELSLQDQARVEEFIGDSLFGLNLWPEAKIAYVGAMQHRGMKGLQINRANCLLGLADSCASLGQLEEALDSYSRAARTYRRFGNELWAAVAELRSFHIESGKARAITRLNSIERVLRKQRAMPFLVELLLVKASSGIDLKHSLAEAARIVNRHGLAGIEWKVEFERAQTEIASGRLAAYRRMAQSMIRSRMLTSSLSGRNSFFRDKVGAVASYVDELLSEHPSSGAREAGKLINGIRSAGLLDEIMLSNRTDAKAEWSRHIQEGRDQLAQSSIQDVRPNLVRLSATSRFAGSALLEFQLLSREFVNSNANDLNDVDPETAIFVQGKSHLYAILNGASYRLGISLDELQSRLRWLHFDLTSPMLSRVQLGCSLSREIDEIRRALISPFLGNAICSAIAPEGIFWTVPWALLFDGMAPPLRIGAWSARPEAQIDAPKSVAILYHDRDDLPHIRYEVEALKSRFPNACFLSSRKEYFDVFSSGDIDLVHVAAHASYNHSNPMFSSIELEDGPLYATEIAKSGTSVRHVVLSACDTGARADSFPYEIDGLTRAFCALGAKFVVASQWPLHDQSAEYLTKLYYDELMVSRSPSKALQVAQQGLKELFEHPYYWSSMHLYEGYSK